MKLYTYPSFSNSEQRTVSTRIQDTQSIMHGSCLELDDGMVLSEVPLVCRYLESLHLAPLLLGSNSEECAVIGIWDRRMEIDGYLAAMEAYRNSAPGLQEQDAYSEIPIIRM
ncbi:glutathione S-transferase family protein [Gluconobacter potus]|uniref:hypothetical protein n=1 Tax=Gluconobacter potus TaxID=2724927 RepID=UPI0012DA791C|nr:hypothetical protein [Gluconobacter potus]